MKNLKLWRITALLPVISMIAFSACTEPDALGIEVQPEGDQPGVYFTDTITIEAKTIREDTLRSDETIAAFNLVGSYADPVFGMSTGSFFAQVRLPNNNTNFSFGTTPTLDSVVLTLAYADYYGDTLTPLNISVYQLDGSMVIDSNYYTNDEIPFNSNDLFTGVIDARPKDSVVVDSSKRAPHLRLKLKATFGTDFINSTTSNFVDNAAFINYFKGIHVKAADVTTPGTGCMLSFNLLASFSKLTFYYKNAANTTTQTANFEINSECPRFNRYTHDYTAATFGSVFPVPGNDSLYIQSMAGLKARIIFPNIKNLSANGAVSINKAELVIPVANNTTYPNHQALIVFGVDSNGGEAIIPDLLESTTYYGGAFTSADQNYRVNIARYLQRLVSGKIATDYGLSIISAGGAVNAFRTVIPGTGVAGNKIKLKLTYSRLE